MYMFLGEKSREKLDSYEMFRMIKILIFRLASWACAVKTNKTRESRGLITAENISAISTRDGTSIFVKFSFHRGDSVHMVGWRC